MHEQLKSMIYLYGDDIYVQMPNSIFKKLSKNIKSKNGSTNIQQSSFAYAYLALVSLLYKYSHFVDVDNSTYIQNSDIKEMLGYSKSTKSIDSIIKKNGLLDSLGITSTSKDYPVRFYERQTNDDNNLKIREFMKFSQLNKDDLLLNNIKTIVKNKNYTIKEPEFLFVSEDGELGTLYEYSNTHRVTLKELLLFVSDDKYNNIDMMMYFFFKSKCKGLKNNTKSISLNSITFLLGISRDSFYQHLKVLKDGNHLQVIHKSWIMNSKDEFDSNEYRFIGI